MATRSTIAIEHEDGTVEQVYCHFDGYLSHNGKILHEHYTDRSKVEQLVALGDMSILGNEIGEKQDFDNPVNGWTLYYGRDRGEDNTAPCNFENRKSYEKLLETQGYEYIFTKENVWMVDYGHGWKNLEEELLVFATD